MPDTILEEWRRELPMLSTHHISRCYYPKEASVVSTQDSPMPQRKPTLPLFTSGWRTPMVSFTLHSSPQRLVWLAVYNTEIGVEWSIDPRTVTLTLQETCHQVPCTLGPILPLFWLGTHVVSRCMWVIGLLR